MMYYDHALLGGTLALALGAQRRHGWGIVFTAAIAGMLPDWDGLSEPFGQPAYVRVHRVWGHNLPAALLAGALFAAAVYLVRTSVDERQPGARGAFSRHDLAAWVLVGALAAFMHVMFDLLYSGRWRSPDWPVKLWWPFSARGWAWPVVPWSDWGATLILLAEVVALCCWPARARALAVLTLLVVVAYVGAWAALGA
jgi:membrane-bound metal-dependent hydrolase YbcI (DUF457 family)